MASLRLGFAYTRKFDDESAIASLEKAVELDHANGGIQGQLDAAEDVSTEAITGGSTSWAEVAL